MCLHLCGKAFSRNLRFYFKCKGGKACVSTCKSTFCAEFKQVTLKFYPYPANVENMVSF